MFRIIIAFVVLLAVPLLSACDKRTPEEKGEDLANEKLGFAKGIANVVEEKGKDLGQSAGRGVGDLVKGIGSGVKDVVHEKVALSGSPEAGQAGLVFADAQLGSPQNGQGTVTVYTTFSQAFKGRIELRALSKEGNEIGRSASDYLDQAADSTKTLTFPFDASLRLSQVGSYIAKTVAPKQVVSSAEAEAAGISIETFKEHSTGLNLYVKFAKPYKKNLEMRAYTAQGQEIGRSEIKKDLKQAKDSAAELSFSFPQSLNLSNASSYQLVPVE